MSEAAGTNQVVRCDGLHTALMGALKQFKIKDHEIIKLSRSPTDGCKQVDKAAVEQNYPIVKAVLTELAFIIPTNRQLITMFTSTNSSFGHELSGARSARSRLEWPHARQNVFT